ncbi:MAG: hypothetical protein OEU92_12035 [Alphaproteobacteria bacterium]|nr:hypothetical protein [Alphaproteobacteria bacterium]
MTHKPTIWVLVSLISLFCISTNQPFVFLEDGTLFYSLAMIVGVVRTSTSEQSLS